MLPKRRIKREIPRAQIENKQKDGPSTLGDAKKLSNAGNRDIDSIKQNNCDTSPCKNVHDTVIEIVHAAKWALRVHYRKVNIRGFIEQ